MKFARRQFRIRVCALALVLAAVTGSGGCDPGVNLDAVPKATAECEMPTSETLQPGAQMLPGRNCMSCHVESGQAGSKPFLTAGTVYLRSQMGGKCNSGGATNVTVEFFDVTDTTYQRALASVTTNEAGNFSLLAPALSKTVVRVRIRRDATMRTMANATDISDGCATCHSPTGMASDRVFLEPP